MKLSTKSRYAITAMMSIAVHEHKGPLTLADISESQGISLSYAEQIFAKLRSADLVEGVRGPGGGYRLGRPANAISITDIIDAVDDVQQNTVSAEDMAATQAPYRPYQMWSDFSSKVHEYLSTLTLDNFMEEAEMPRISQPKDTTASRIAHMFKPRSLLAGL